MNERDSRLVKQERLYPTEKEERTFRELKQRYGVKDVTRAGEGMTAIRKILLAYRVCVLCSSDGVYEFSHTVTLCDPCLTRLWRCVGLAWVKAQRAKKEKA